MSARRPVRIAVVGATGLVGREFGRVLDQRLSRWNLEEVRPFASSRSLGKTVRFAGKDWTCRALERGCFDGIDIVFFDASDAVSKEWAVPAADAGAWVVDSSAAYRLDPEVPLVVPEVNGDLVRARVRLSAGGGARGKARIFAGPNCTAGPMTVALQPILKGWGIRRLVISTYQSVSGAGAKGTEELERQAADRLAGKKVVAGEVFPHPIAFNCIPHIGGFAEDGSTSEERKTVDELRKILARPEMRVSATTVRVPTFVGHGATLNVECERSFKLSDVRAALSQAPGTCLEDDPAQKRYPMNVLANGADPVFVGRLRVDGSVPNGLNFWMVADNLRKGAALNAIQIGEILLEG